jgi:hypothetical protein
VPLPFVKLVLHWKWCGSALLTRRRDDGAFLLFQWRKRSRFTAPFSFITPQFLVRTVVPPISDTALTLRKVRPVPLQERKIDAQQCGEKFIFRSPQLRECGKLG